ncbi:MAG: ABC transporter substrate-binding protein [Clostridiales bacterium]|jgi:peptide/nickel transport system substrate-binding protein|nr:ABC transporter substrate-binding protein [Clostridiales bacterium]
MNKYILFFLLLILASCGGERISPSGQPHSVAEEEEIFDEPDDEPEAIIANAQTVMDDGVLRLHMRQPMTLNPLLNEDVTVARILRLIFEPLAVLDDEFRVTGFLADLEFASDYSSVNATIRESAIWSDGMPVTADDVIFSIEFLRAAPNSAIYKNKVENIASAVRIDARTVQIIFERASVSAGYCLNFPIIPQHYYSGETNARSGKNMAPLGSGPFAFAAYTPMRSMTLTRNAFNPGRIETAEIVILPNIETDFNAFETGRIDAIELPLTEWTRARSPEYEIFPAMYFEFIGFNFRRNIFRDILTRQGIAHAFNADEAVAGLYLSYAVRCGTPIHPYNWAADDEILNPVYDLPRAAALLGTIRLDEPLVILANEENPQRASIARRLAQSLISAGLSANAEVIPTEEYFARIAAHDFDLYIGGMELSFAPDAQIFFTGGEMFLHDPILENAYAAILFASTEAAHIQAVSHFQEIFTEQLPVIGLAFRHSAVLTSPRISSDLNPAPDHVFANVHEWQIDR